MSIQSVTTQEVFRRSSIVQDTLKTKRRNEALRKRARLLARQALVFPVCLAGLLGQAVRLGP